MNTVPATAPFPTSEMWPIVAVSFACLSQESQKTTERCEKNKKQKNPQGFLFQSEYECKIFYLNVCHLIIS